VTTQSPSASLQRTDVECSINRSSALLVGSWRFAL
jgi:hypothetical protein